MVVVSLKRKLQTTNTKKAFVTPVTKAFLFLYTFTNGQLFSALHHHFSTVDLYFLLFFYILSYLSVIIVSLPVTNHLNNYNSVTNLSL